MFHVTDWPSTVLFGSIYGLQLLIHNCMVRFHVPSQIVQQMQLFLIFVDAYFSPKT